MRYYRAAKRFKYTKSVIGDYPLYDVPFKSAERLLPPQQVQANYDYFIENRMQRLAYFEDWLNRHFSTPVPKSWDELSKFNRWANDFSGGLIVGDPDYSGQTFATYAPAWIDDNAGFNIIIDIGIAIGEFFIQANDIYYWGLSPLKKRYPSVADEPEISYARPRLKRDSRRESVAPLTLGYDLVFYSRTRSQYPFYLFSKIPLFLVERCKLILASDTAKP